MGSCEQALIRGFPNGETHLQRTVISTQSVMAGWWLLFAIMKISDP